MGRTLSAAQAKAAMDMDKNIYVLDLRDEYEFKTGHIAGSINIPLEDIGIINKIIPNCNAKIFVCCKAGKHSRSACTVLLYLGYKNVWNIGGVRDWPYGLVR